MRRPKHQMTGGEDLIVRIDFHKIRLIFFLAESPCRAMTTIFN
jgi:hypothetical protein